MGDKPQVTGWIYTDTKNFSNCSKCGQKAGVPCITPKGRKARYPHLERLAAYRVNHSSVHKIKWCR